MAEEKTASAKLVDSVALTLTARRDDRRYARRMLDGQPCRRDGRRDFEKEWAREGIAARGPVAGVVVVWPHHVGEIWDGPDKRGRWLVHSGNDGNAVRTRWRSLFGVIAFRWVR